MINAAERMKAQGRQQQESGAPTSIFGSAMGLAQSIESEERYRVSLYPIICAEMPEIAMGLASCLGYLLEQYPSTRIYRCFAKIDPADEGAEIDASDFQFQAADWELTGLADNVLLSGSLEVTTDGLVLRFSLDASLLGAGEVEQIYFRFVSLADAVGSLPRIATEIMQVLAEEESEQAIISYAQSTVDAGTLNELLELVFDWNLDVYLYFWDVAWDEADVRAQFMAAAKLCLGGGNEFACWCLGMMAKQVMQPGVEEIGDILLPIVTQEPSVQDISAAGAAALAIGLSTLGYKNPAVDLLQPYLGPDADASVWRSLIDIHLNAGQFDEAFDANQVALESGLQHPALYWQYAELLMTAEANEWAVEEVLLIDPDEFEEEDHIGLEIANALKLHLAGAPGNLAALQLALAYMIDVDDEELWVYFEQLVRQDRAGVYIGDVIDRLLDLEDYDPAYDILDRQLDNNTYAYVFLSQLALADDNPQLARETIAACRGEIARLDDDLELELQRLELAAKLPGFNEEFADLKIMLSENRPISEEMVERLESAIEAAPKLIDLYIILSRCYLKWNDSSSAFEVLQDAAREAGGHPQIELGMAQILWTTDKKEEAIAKLNAGLEEYPSSVHLLAQMANYLITNNQFDDARQYIARAEAIAPSHRALSQLRRLVAQKMAE